MNFDSPLKTFMSRLIEAQQKYYQILVDEADLAAATAIFQARHAAREFLKAKAEVPKPTGVLDWYPHD